MSQPKEFKLKQPISKFTRKIAWKYHKLLNSDYQVTQDPVSKEQKVIFSLASIVDAENFLVWALFGFSPEEIDEMHTNEFDLYKTEAEKLKNEDFTLEW